MLGLTSGDGRQTVTGETEPRWLTDGQQQAWRAYLRGGRLLMEALDRGLTPHGLCLSEYEILSMLSEAPEQRMRMSELAELVVQSRSRLTHTATRMERRGWVTREPFAGDRRGVLLILTDAGRETILATAPIHLADVRRHLVDRLSPAQLTGLGEAMGIVRDALTVADERAEGDGPDPTDGDGQGTPAGPPARVDTAS